MSYTKGPWEWNPKLRDILAQSERGDEVGGKRYWRTIAGLELTGQSPRHEVETDANGRLIAAAPLMLEALENLENDDGLRMPDSAWELVQQAVEAATGRRKPSAAEMRGES